MDAELAATSMAQTFERVQLAPADAAAAGAAAAGTGSSSAESAAAAGGGSASGSSAADASLTPLDLDFNLIQSMVASHAAQGGLPGPASNLAGLLGLTLPVAGGGASHGDGVE
jgi:hypothetical protein